LTPRLQSAHWTRADLESILTPFAAEQGLGFGKLAACLRAALAGRTTSPSVYDMMLVLGRDETLARLGDAAA
jgi:glutamyl-tRNA synthetase